MLAFNLAKPGQCRSMACGVSQLETRSRGWEHGWELHSVHCLLPLPGHRGKSWLGDRFWEEEFKRVTSEISPLTRVKYRGISLDSTLFSHDQAGIGPIIPLSVRGT